MACDGPCATPEIWNPPVSAVVVLEFFRVILSVGCWNMNNRPLNMVMSLPRCCVGAKLGLVMH